MTAKTPEPKTMYATKVAIPARLIDVATANAKLISQVTVDAYKFIHSRCNKNLQIGVVVSLGLSSLMQEYEKGEFTKYEDFDEEAVAKENAHALHGREIKMAERINALVDGKPKAWVAEMQKVAEAIYNEQRGLKPTNDQGEPFPDFWDEAVLDKTRMQYFLAASAAMKAMGDE